MDFFKSVFSADPDPDPSSSSSSSLPNSPGNPPDDAAAADDSRTQEAAAADSPDDDDDDDDDDDNGFPALGAGGWSIGGLIKTLSSKSESVIQTYRRDLEEFGSGLRKETVAIREAAARAVRDLPGSLEVGASAAQESLESVGQAIDDIGGSVWRGTAEIIAHSKDAILAMETEASNNFKDSSSDPLALKKINSAAPSKPYSRFEAQVLAIQSEPSTFSEEPEDGEDFSRWRLEFDLAAKEEEIEILCYENAALEGFLEKLVPRVIDYETFWCRYYYRVHKLKQAEDARSKLVKRAIAADEEEDLSWEVDDDEEEVKKEEEKDKKEKKDVKVGEDPELKGENKEVEVKLVSKEVLEPVEEVKSVNKENLEPVEEVKSVNKENLEPVEEVESVNKEILEPVEEVKSVSQEVAQPLEEKEVAEVPQVKNLEAPVSEIDEEVTSMAVKDESNQSTNEEVISKLADNPVQETKVETSGSCKDSDFSIVSSQPSVQEEEDDLGWDEIEDLGEHDDKKPAGASGSPLRTDLRKRLSVADEDEDLSWDIEEDDEPAKP